MIKKIKDIPPGVSEWKRAGLKYGYCNYFETEIRKDWKDELKATLQEKKAFFEKAKGGTMDSSMYAKAVCATIEDIIFLIDRK